jgi:hypothetical protein
MANPSTTGGTGAGTEVLRRFYKSDLTSTEVKIIDGVADHIYTLLSLVVTEQGVNTGQSITLKIQQGASGSDANVTHLLRNQVIGLRQTFVFSEKIIITDTDELIIYTSDSGTNMDVLCTYIDQTF